MTESSNEKTVINESGNENTVIKASREVVSGAESPWTTIQTGLSDEDTAPITAWHEERNAAAESAQPESDGSDEAKTVQPAVDEPETLEAAQPAAAILDKIGYADAVHDQENVAQKGKGFGRGLLAFVAGFVACVALVSILTFGLGLGRFMSKGDWDYYHDLDENYGKYAIIMDMIGEDPLSKPVPEEISDEVLKDIIAKTGDPYAEYFTPEEYAQFQKTYTGGYVGIGIGVVDEGGTFIIKTIYDDGPAQKAGLQEEDIILEVDGVVPEDLDDAVARMTGEADTEVTVTVSRNGEKMDFTMTRAEIDLKSVGYAVSEEDPEVGYIRITVFRRGTCDEFKNAVKELSSKGCNKFILDLRDNGGGLTDECIDIADYLLPSCVIMTDVTKNGSETVYNSKDSSADLDMVVLVNRNTASASEILTAALQENGAAKVIGEQTYGKGVTQLSRSFSDGSAVKLTVTEYLTPKGNHVQGNGCTPDIKATDEECLDKAYEELGN